MENGPLEVRVSTPCIQQGGADRGYHGVGARSVCVELLVCRKGDQNVEKTYNILIATEELIF